MEREYSDSLRGIGGISVGAGFGLIAEHLGMTRWEVLGVVLLIGIGLTVAITGRWKNW